MKRFFTILLILSVAMPAFAIWPFKTTKPVKDTDTIHIYNPKLPDDNVKTRERPDESEKVNVENLEKLAKAGNTLIIPTDLANVAGFIKAASSVIDATKAKA